MSFDTFDVVLALNFARLESTRAITELIRSCRTDFNRNFPRRSELQRIETQPDICHAEEPLECAIKSEIK